MATYFTKEEARTAARAQSLRKSLTADSLLEEAIVSSKERTSFDIFLSHSIRDAELVIGVKTLLEQMGFSVYVDWVIDKQLSRDAVTKETAHVLRERMKQSKALIYMATENAPASKWMPWELGYFDGQQPGQVAILPVLDRAGEHFVGQEYLGLYPVVRKDSYSDGRPDVFVEEVGVRWRTLSSFGKAAGAWQKYGPS